MLTAIRNLMRDLFSRSAAAAPVTDPAAGRAAEALAWDMADQGIRVVLYTGGRIAVTDAGAHCYADATAILRREIAARGLPLLLVDPLY